MKTLSELLQWGKAELAFLGSDEGDASAEVLLSEVLNLSRTSLYLEARQSVSDDHIQIYQEWVAGRKQRIPTAYLTGVAHFWNETLSVDSGCLVPRPETEALIKAFIECSGFSQNSSFSFADLGSGSGAIGIALLRTFPKARGSFLDISEKALAVTRRNLERYGLLDRAETVRTDLFHGCSGLSWDAIISNPPYFTQQDWAEVEPEVLKEPREALDGGNDGLLFYRQIADNAPKHLRAPGLVLVEVGKGQSTQVDEIFRGQFSGGIQIFKDNLNIERAVMARMGSNG